jgi:hypothetical protein
LEKHKAEVVQENISKVQEVVQEQDDIIIPASGEWPAATSADHQIEQRHPLFQVDRLKGQSRRIWPSRATACI